MRAIYTAALAAFLLLSCNSGEPEQSVSENEIDAARNFIDAALKGHWNDARKLLLPDSTNLQILEAAENNYSLHMTREDKRGYNEASINILDTRAVDATTSVVQYSNSYKKKQDSLKVVKQGAQWLIDLKYSFPQTDTTIHVE